MCDKLVSSLLAEPSSAITKNSTCIQLAKHVAESANVALKDAVGPNVDHTQFLIAALIMIVVTEEIVRRTLYCIWRMRTRKRRGRRGRGESTNTQVSEFESEDEEDSDVEMAETQRVAAPADSDEDVTLTLQNQCTSRV